MKTYLGIAAVAIILIIIYRWKMGKKNCEDKKSSAQVKIVLFYQDGCPPCEELKPIWNAVVDKHECDEIQFSKVDLRKNPVEGITHTPTILAHKNGQTLKYNGPRTFESICEFVTAL